jgi:hypothetical protein
VQQSLPPQLRQVAASIWNFVGGWPLPSLLTPLFLWHRLGVYIRVAQVEIADLNVEKNKAILLRTNKCKGCYLAYAKLSGMDLAHADLRRANLIGVTFIRATLFGADLSGAKIAGANFSGALWIDGSICQAGSVGRCIKKQQ